MIYFSNLVRDVKNELSHFLVSKICNGLPRNVTKFAYGMVWGMLSSGSCKVSMIGRRLFERDIRTTENRLTKNLMELDLSGLKNNHWEYAFGELLKLEPNIIIDEMDVIKPFGKAFEGLAIIHDGSKEGKPREKGWPVTGIVALTEKNFVIPLVTNVYSPLSVGHKSICHETRRHLDAIIPKVREAFRCTCSFDRGYDGSNYANYVDGSGHFYVIRAKEKRIYKTRVGKMNALQIAKKYKGRYSFNYKNRDGLERFAKASAVKANHKDFPSGVWVVFESFVGEAEPRAYITNIDCSTKDGVTKALKAYRLRWRIEEFFRFVKQEYGFERFMVRTLRGINNLLACMNIAVAFLTYIIVCKPSLWGSIQDVYQPLTNLEREEMLEKKYGRYGINLYRAKLGIQIILGHAKGRPPIPGRDRRKRTEQLKLF